MKLNLKRALIIEILILSLLSITMIGFVKAAPKEITAKKVSHSPSNPGDPAWSKISGTDITLGANEIVGGHGRPDLSETPTMNIKTAYNDKELFMYFKWRDSTYDNYQSYWDFDGSKWNLSEPEQDRLYMMWPIVDAPGRDGKTFSEGGCATICHKYNTANNSLVETTGSLNACGTCHKNASNSPKTSSFSHATDEPEGVDEICAYCHGDRTFNNVATVDGGPVTVGADMVAPQSGAYDIWHWKAGTAGLIGLADDQSAVYGKKRANDGSPGLDYDNINSAKDGPKYIWPLNESATASTYDKDELMTKRDVTNFSELSADGLTLIDGITPVPIGTSVRKKIVNDLDASSYNGDIGAYFKRSNGYYHVVLRRKLDSKDSKDYKFDLNGDNLFSIAVTNASEINHAGSILQNLKFGKDSTPPAANLSLPAISAKYSSSTKFNVNWQGDDGVIGSGIKAFDIDYKKYGSTSWSRWLSATQKTTDNFGTSYKPVKVLPGNVFLLRARAIDEDGNIGSWSETKSTIVPFDQNVFSYSSGWGSSANSLYYLSGNKSSNLAKKTASYTLNGTAVYLLSTKGPNKGKAKIYVDGSLVKEVDLYAAGYYYRSVAFSKSWTEKSKHTIKIEVSGAKNSNSTGTQIDIDGIAVKP